VGIQGNCDVRSNQECGWPFLYKTSRASWFVANTTEGKPYGTTSGHNRTQGTRWPGVVYVNGVHEFKGARSNVCVYKPSSRPHDDRGMARNSAASDGLHGGFSSLI